MSPWRVRDLHSQNILNNSLPVKTCSRGQVRCLQDEPSASSGNCGGTWLKVQRQWIMSSKQRYGKRDEKLENPFLRFAGPGLHWFAHSALRELGSANRCWKHSGDGRAGNGKKAPASSPRKDSEDDGIGRAAAEANVPGQSELGPFSSLTLSSTMMSRACLISNLSHIPRASSWLHWRRESPDGWQSTFVRLLELYHGELDSVPVLHIWPYLLILIFRQ